MSLVVACNSGTGVEIENKHQGNLKAAKTLQVVGNKKFPLDSLSAPRPPYIQLYTDPQGKEFLAMLSAYSQNISIYEYDSSSAPVSRISVNQVQIPLAFHIKNMDSIFVYDDKLMEMVLLDNKFDIVSKVSLINNENIKDLSWTFKYPQYVPHTVNEMLEREGKLIFPGQYIWTLPDSLTRKFKFASVIDMDHSNVKYIHKYPYELYGHNYMWDEPMFTTAYYDMMPGNNRLVYSFPVSHDLFIYDLDADSVKAVYGGSNFAASIRSMDRAEFKQSKIPQEYIYQTACTTDLYGGIIYDKYRDVYYRFIRKALPGKGVRLRWENKPVAVVIMDKEFNYLGETEIGNMNEYYPDNAFVTREGLNIEYVDPADVEEKFLWFKIFSPKDI